MISRRDVLAGTTGLTAYASLGGSVPVLAQTAPKYTPEPGASLRLLRWSPFVKGDDAAWNANTEKFTKETGVQVRIDRESWEDIRPKAAVAANVGAGPDLIMVWFDDAHQYPDKLVDLTDIGMDLGQRYGGWYAGLESYARRDGKFIALPLAAIGNALLWRQSIIEKAGFKEMPKDHLGFLELCRAIKGKGLPPAGFSFGKAVGDGNNWCHWLLWSHGGKMVDDQNKVVLNSPETINALNYAREIYKTFITGTESWLDINNNRAFLAGEVSVTANGVSLYYSAKNEDRYKELVADIRSGPLPIGPVGQSVELHQTTSLCLFRYSKFPNAARAYLQFMYDKPQYDSWINGSSAYCCQALKAFANNPVWTADPIHVAYSKASETLRVNGYAGQLGYASAAAMADYIVVDMFAEAATGQQTPEEAAKRAEARANRYYRV